MLQRLSGLKMMLMVSALGSFTAFSKAQEPFLIAEYLVEGPGDTLEYANVAQEQPPLRVFYSLRENFRGLDLVKRADSHDSYRLQQWDPAKGLRLYMLFLPTDQRIIFDHPAWLLPAQVKQGETYRDEVGYTVFEGNRKVGTGTALFEVSIAGMDSADTPLQNFDHCLALDFRLTRTDTGESPLFFESREWYARGVGLVKMAGKNYRLDKLGRPEDIFRQAYSLSGAFIGGIKLQKKGGSLSH